MLSLSDDELSPIHPAVSVRRETAPGICLLLLVWTRSRHIRQDLRNGWPRQRSPLLASRRRALCSYAQTSELGNNLLPLELRHDEHEREHIGRDERDA